MRKCVQCKSTQLPTMKRAREYKTEREKESELRTNKHNIKNGINKNKTHISFNYKYTKLLIKLMFIVCTREGNQKRENEKNDI